MGLQYGQFLMIILNWFGAWIKCSRIGKNYIYAIHSGVAINLANSWWFGELMMVHKCAQSIAHHHLRSKDPIPPTSTFPQLALLSMSIKSNQSQCAQHQHHQCASFLFLPSLLALPFLSSYPDHLYPQDPHLHLIHPSCSPPLCNLNHHFLCQPTPLSFHLANFGCMRWSLGAQDVPGVGKSRIDECCISIKWLPPSSLIPFSSSFSWSFFPFQQFICIALHCDSITPVHWPRKMLGHLCHCYPIFLSPTVNVFKNPQWWHSLHSTQ